VLVGLAIGVVGVELCLRWAGFEPPKLLSKRYLSNDSSEPRVNYHCYPTNPHGEFSPLPDMREGDWRLMNVMLPPERLGLEELAATPWCVEYRHSQLGLRDRDYDAEPSPEKLRIALMGDSFAFGEGVPLELSLSRRLESQLAGCEVINAGKPGLDNQMELFRFRDLLPALHPQRAIVVFTANDIALTPDLQQKQTFINDLINIRDEYLDRRQTKAWYNGRSRVIQLLGGWWEMRQITAETIGWYLDSYNPRYNAENLARLQEQIATFGKAPNCEVALVLYPLMEGLEGEYPLARVHETVAEMARHAGLPVLDLAPAFAGQSTRELWVHETDHHPNARAHEIAAKAIADWLRKDVPEFLEPEAEQSAK
jgi:lysophospholipase L1-like esterase